MKRLVPAALCGLMLANAVVSVAVADAPKATLPLAVYDEAGAPMPYIPSGYMGNTTAIKMTDNTTENPKVGKTCLKVDYTARDNWGGVVWQSPANDWEGAQPGGFNLTGAKKLSFWARGDKGGESVSFSFGLIGADKKYHDTAKGELKDTSLTKEWKQYTIDLTGKDLSTIKTGFCWALGSKGEPVTFYLDDIKYE